MSIVTIPIHKFLGQPYKINVIIKDAGKNIGGTKIRVTWRLGWSQEVDVVHEITLLHSTFSGKKTIFENGKEIHSEGTSDLIDRGFEYSWKSISGLTSFKLIGSYGFMKERDYELFINNIEFSLLPQKGPEHKPIVSKPISIIDSTTNNNKIQINSTNNKIPIANQNNVKKSSPTSRPRTESFDPFSPSVSLSDPFTTNESNFDSFDTFQTKSKVETKQQQFDPYLANQMTSTIFTNFPKDNFNNFLPSSATSSKSEGYNLFQPTSPISNVTSLKISNNNAFKENNSISPNSITDNQFEKNKIPSSNPIKKITVNESISSMHNNNNKNLIDDTFSNLTLTSSVNYGNNIKPQLMKENSNPFLKEKQNNNLI